MMSKLIQKWIITSKVEFNICESIIDRQTQEAHGEILLNIQFLSLQRYLVVMSMAEIAAVTMKAGMTNTTVSVSVIE